MTVAFSQASFRERYFNRNQNWLLESHANVLFFRFMNTPIDVTGANEVIGKSRRIKNDTNFNIAEKQGRTQWGATDDEKGKQIQRQTDLQTRYTKETNSDKIML